MQLYCADTKWDSDGRTPYDSVAEFLEMCRDCWGEAPELIGDDDDGYRYASGPEAGHTVLSTYPPKTPKG